ncbi:MAG: precorrin-4 C(11)-methyltransferase [Oscillochloridaceae bacterium umkhey_bin13]
MDEHVSPGTVYFIGAGPGAPDLITVRGQAIIAQADLVLYADSLVQASVAGLARKPSARIVGSSDLNLAQLVDLMAEAARAGEVVARVHTGDPALFGATHEQMRLLAAQAIPYTVVPGVTAAFAAAARLGIEFTLPEVTQTLILSRIAGRTPVPEPEALHSLASHGASLALYLSVDQIEQVAHELLAGGSYLATTPVAVVYRVTWPDEQILRGTLAELVTLVRSAGLTRHTLILVGAALAPDPQTAVSRLYAPTFAHGYRAATSSAPPTLAGNELLPDHVLMAASPSPTRGAGGAHSSAAAEHCISERTPIADSANQSAPTVIAVTRAGAELAMRLGQTLDSIPLVPARFAPAGDRTKAYAEPVADVIRAHWATSRALVLIMATGIAVRALAPLLDHKTRDPAVVCLDEAGQSVIPLLGGHRAGANALARRIATLTGGHAAVTTASDIQDQPALDLLGRELGWQVDPDSAMTHAMSGLVNGEAIGCYVDPALPEPRHQLVTWFADCPNVTFVAQPEELLEARYYAALLVTHRALEALWAPLRTKTVRYRLPLLVVGLGCRRGVPADELHDALIATLADTNLDGTTIAALATIDHKADEDGLLALADRLGVPLQIVASHAVAQLDRDAFSASAAQRHFDLPGVAEPCATLVAGGPLLVPKRAFARCTVAVALIANAARSTQHAARLPSQLPPAGERSAAQTRPDTPVASSGASSQLHAKGTDVGLSSPAPADGSEGQGGRADGASQCPKPSLTTDVARAAPESPGQLTLVSLGPGDPQQMTLAAHTALREAEVVVGYQGYINAIAATLTPNQLIIASGMKTEIERAQQALTHATAGRRVALVSSGDIGIYAMAGPVFELLAAQGWTGTAPTVTVLPGISAFQAAAAKLGAAISHDFAVISLSDLLTPWELIVQRLHAAAAGDFVIALYNPRSRERHWQLGAALEIVRTQRPATTPVAFATNVARPDEQISLTTLAEADPTEAAMFTVVLIGNRRSYRLGAQFVTPRGYAEAKLPPDERHAPSSGAHIVPAQLHAPLGVHPSPAHEGNLPASADVDGPPALPGWRRSLNAEQGHHATDYPIVLTNLTGRLAVVVGGGAVGERKARGLLATGLRIRLISPTATPQLQAWAAEQRLTWVQRGYHPDDLAGAVLVFAATNQRALNAQIARTAITRGLLCNVADDPSAGNVHLPALYRGTDVTVAVSTSGVAPARAAALRDRIARWLTGDAPEEIQ